MNVEALSSSSELAPVVLSRIDEWVAKFPEGREQSALLQALMCVQEHYGHLTVERMDAVALYLKVPKIAAYEVATFYTMYDLKPVGRHKISVCTNISCMLRGSDQVVSYLEEKLGVKMGETTADGQFTLKATECMAACGGAPMLEVNKQYHENLDPQKIDAILAELSESHEPS